jgi:hypothetical protein
LGLDCEIGGLIRVRSRQSTVDSSGVDRLRVGRILTETTLLQLAVGRQAARLP